MQSKVQKDDEPQGFDLVVTKRHPKTGLVIERNPYILRVCGEGTNRTQYLERPKGSGNLWNFKGEAVGVWDKSKPEGQRFIKGAKHVAWEPPLTDDEKVSIENAELRKELAAAKAELEAKKKVAQAKVLKGNNSNKGA